MSGYENYRHIIVMVRDPFPPFCESKIKNPILSLSQICTSILLWNKFISAVGTLRNFSQRRLTLTLRYLLTF